MDDQDRGSIITLIDIDSIVEIIRPRIGKKPRVGVILGSGLGALAESIEEPV